MLEKRFLFLVGLLVTLSMILSACGPTATATTAPASTAAPATPAATTRHGGWLDEIDVSVVAPGSEISQIQAGAIDLYSSGLPPAEAKAVKDSGLGYVQSYSTYYGTMMNPAVFKDPKVLNPFSDRKIREAMNWLVDRNYVNQEIYGGGALPKLTPLTTQLVDYTGVIDVARALESKYAYNIDKAKEVMSAEMTGLGATAGADGKWQFNGKPVTLIFLIRTDGDGTRKPMGDYISSQLEKVGFTVDREYKKSSEASPIWRQTDPVDGKWNMYTAGWGSPGLTRDERTIFDYMYLPDSGQGEQVFYANKNPDPEFLKLGQDLFNGNFKTLQERHDMIAKALPLAIQDSVQAWVVDTLHFYPFKKGLQVTYDLASGVESAAMSSYNLRWADKEGGTVKVGASDLLTDPWNPVAGDNWTWDGFVMQATTSYGVMPDPYTGLAWPMRIAKAEVTAQTGLPITQSLGWVTLNTADTIPVPDDAWAQWDAKNQVFVSAKDRAAADAKAKKTFDDVDSQAKTAAGALDFKAVNAQALVKFVTDLGAFYTQASGNAMDVATAVGTADNKKAIADEVTKIKGLVTDADRQTELVAFATGFIQGLDTSGTLAAGSGPDANYTQTAKIKSVVTYPADLFKTVKWQDGSPISVADFIMPQIMQFDLANPESPIYDESMVANFEATLPSFKGFRITSTDPLTIEYYSDNYQSDAELDVATLWPTGSWGLAGHENSWPVLALGNMAQAAGELAYTPDLADAKKIEYMSFIGGPSLDILSKHLDEAESQSLVPYTPTLGKYITADEAKARYTALKAFYTAHKHFWVGTGPYVLDKVFTTEKTATLKNNPDFPDLADRWSSFSTPKLAVAALDGPPQVKIGDQAVFDVTVTFNGDPYPQADIKQVKYLLYDATGVVLSVGDAAAVADGHYQVTLGSDVTSKLVAGSNKIEVAAVPIPVAIPAFTSLDFVVVP